MSTAVQEAMACGVPVIMRRTASGMDGVIVHGKTGMVLEYDDELGQAVDKLFYSQSLWHEISTNARKVAEKEFSIQNAAEKWLAFLQDLKPGIKPETFRMPTLKEIRKVCVGHEIRRFGLNPAKVSNLMLQGLGWQPFYEKTPKHCHTWDIRYKFLYLGIEYGCINSEQAAELAGDLVLEMSSSQNDNNINMYNKASLLQLAKNFSKSKQLFKDILIHSINIEQSAGCYYHLGGIAMEEGDEPAAYRYFEKCLAICPEHEAAQEKIQNLGSITRF